MSLVQNGTKPVLLANSKSTENYRQVSLRKAFRPQAREILPRKISLLKTNFSLLTLNS